MAAPTYDQNLRRISSQLRINPRVMRESVPQLQFNPSVGIIARDIDKLGIDIRSFREPLKRAVQQVVIPSIQQNFESEGRPAWEPYASSTVEVREKLGQPVGDLLNKTGALKRTMGYLNLWTINANAAILLDIPLWYGKIQHEGNDTSMASAVKTKGGAQAFADLQNRIRRSMQTGQAMGSSAGAIPARPFVMVQAEDVVAINEVFALWLQERVDLHWSRRA